MYLDIFRSPVELWKRFPTPATIATTNNEKSGRRPERCFDQCSNKLIDIESIRHMTMFGKRNGARSNSTQCDGSMLR